MSYHTVAAILEKQAQPRGFARFVLIALAGFANNKTLKCHPSMASIAERATICERFCIDCVKALEAAGHVKVTRKKKAGRSNVNHYEIILGCENPVVVPRRKWKQKGGHSPPFHVNNSANVTPNDSSRVTSKKEEKRVVSAPKKGGQSPPESIINQSVPVVVVAVREEKGGLGGKGEREKEADPPPPVNGGVPQPQAAAANNNNNSIVQEMVKEPEPEQRDYSYGMGDRQYIPQQEWNRMAKENPHLISYYAKNRFPVVSIAGIVTRIEP